MEALRGNRSSRSPADISLISGFVKSYLPQVAGVLSDSDLHDLSNEIDWVTASNNSIVFLQNEVADCYYLIGKGSVNLYYEADDCVSHALQMSFRPASCSQLGSYLGQLIRGHGFGEYALLANNLSKSAASSPNKRRNKDTPWPAKPQRKSKTEEQHQPAGRSCTAVCGADDTLLFVVYEATYNRIFKKFHHAQRQLAHCIHFMSKLPIFRHASLAKVTQVAFKTTKTKLPFKAVLGECGYNIECVSVLMSGVVRVGARPEATSSSQVLLDDAFILESPSVTSVETAVTNMTSMSGFTGVKGSGMVGGSMVGSMVGGSIISSNSAVPPLPSIATLKAGQIVGDLEVRKGLNTYKFHYDVQSLSVEVLQIPHEVYLECARDAAFNDPNCANLTVLSDTERAQRSAERLHKLRVVHGCDVGAGEKDTSVVVGETEEIEASQASRALQEETETPRSTSDEGNSFKKVSFLDDPESTLAPTHTAAHQHPPQRAPQTAPHTAPHTTSQALTQLVPLLNLSATAPPMYAPLASPPHTARPSKTSYRTQRQRSTSFGSASSTPRSPRKARAELVDIKSTDRTVYGEQTSRTEVSELTDRSTTSTINATSPVFAPAPPIGASPRTTRPGLSTTTSTQYAHYTQSTTSTQYTQYTQARPLGAGYVDIADPSEPLEGRYPEHTQGPNVCTSYASSAAEAAQAVAQEMRAIRQRVRVKQKSLGAEEIRLDPAGF